MSQFPNFLDHGYQVEKELSQNRAGGRVAYLANDLKNNCKVVIKQFQFAKTDATWAEYDSYGREIETLRRLDHPNIPRYLNSFQTEAGFCMVQEYKPARALGTPRAFDPQDIYTIAKSVLEILVYLQSRIPPVIHRDIKPENILVDENINVYLVDFGFARIGDGELGMSSVVKGTMGFMPPEQIFNRQLTEASDLYGLGVTLVCLLTNTKSVDVGNLIDINNRISFRHLVPKLSLQWVRWLEKMVEPNLKQRFANAADALAAMPSTLIVPEALFSVSRLDLTSTRLGEKLSRKISLRNRVPHTELTGKWSVAPHPNDPPHTPDRHTWISVTPPTFQGNQVDCLVTVDTAKLMSNKVYERQLLLETNSVPKTYKIDLKVQTAAVVLPSYSLPYPLLALLLLGAGGLTWVLAWVVMVLGGVIESPTTAIFAAILGTALGLEIAGWVLGASGATVGAAAGVLAGIMVGGGVVLITPLVKGVELGIGAIASLGIGAIAGISIGIATGAMVETLLAHRFNRPFALWVSMLTVAVGAILGLGGVVGFLNPFVLVALLTTGLPLSALLLQLPLHRARLLSDYRRAEQFLIKP